MPQLGLPDERSQLSALRKGDPRKVWLEMLLRKQTIASHAWIAERLATGEASSVSRWVSQAKADPEALEKVEQ